MEKGCWGRGAAAGRHRHGVQISGKWQSSLLKSGKMFFKGKQASCSQVRTCLLNRGVGAHARCVSWGLATSALSKKGWSELGERRGGGLTAAVGEILIAELPYFKFWQGNVSGSLLHKTKRVYARVTWGPFLWNTGLSLLWLLVGNNVPCPCLSLGVWGHFSTQNKACNLNGISFASIWFGFMLLIVLT